MPAPRKEGEPEKLEIPTSMLGIGRKSMLRFGEVPSLEAILKHGRDLKDHEELYGLLSHLNFAGSRREPMPERLLPLRTGSILDLKENWGIFADEDRELYRLDLRKGAFTDGGEVFDWEWWEVWNGDPGWVLVNSLNIQPEKPIKGWELVLIQYETRSGDENPKDSYSYLLGWVRQRELNRLVLEADHIFYSYNPKFWAPKGQKEWQKWANGLERERQMAIERSMRRSRLPSARIFVARVII